MVSVAEPVRHLEPWDPDEPAVAHWAHVYDPTRGICGARILGIEAHPDTPRCEECERILEELR